MSKRMFKKSTNLATIFFSIIRGLFCSGVLYRQMTSILKKSSSEVGCFVKHIKMGDVSRK
jgi:hypothetical protein